MSTINKDPDEKLKIQFDFSEDLLSGESVTSAEFEVTVPRTSIEKSPADIIDPTGVDIVDGKYVLPRIVGGKPGVTYRIKCKGMTDQPNVYAVSVDIVVGTRFGTVVQ